MLDNSDVNAYGFLSIVPTDITTMSWLEIFEVRRKQAAKKRHRRLRDQCDPFEIYTDAQFVKEYRLNKTLARDLCEEIRPFLKTPQKATDLSVETKVCDADMQIISVDASHGGATHDSFIWSSHPLKDYMEELSNNENVWFLGDSGYPLRRYMMTPVLNAAPNTPEAHYTNLHVHTRNIIERTIGLLKARFRCLLLHRRLHYQPEVAGSIVNSCVILHNMCNGAKLPPQELTTEERQEESRLVAIYSAHSSIPVTEGGRGNIALQQGVAVRNALIQRLWERR
ncbi:uncharacterized protein LOC132904016 [Amyelois transitella]|uniref:uncharacterized protein LOC132904016 n=1 Tax=Amyelois transitella TaxID=680683 RepID=UPI002990746E|nr:uncharacterized protein LOC132904016 [Amyelois transitella]